MNNPTIYYADINDHDETGSDEPVFCHVVLASEYNQLRAELASLKAQQPSGVVLPALMAALESVVHNERVPNDVSQECAAILIETRRLNPSPVNANQCGDCGFPFTTGSHCMSHSQHSASAGGVDERAAFEHHPKFRGMDFSRVEGANDFYDSPYANGAWHGWQARAALTASAPNHSEQVREAVEVVGYACPAQLKALKCETSATCALWNSAPNLNPALAQRVPLMTVAQHQRIVALLTVTGAGPVAEVSAETFSSDGTSDIITRNLPIGTKLYTHPADPDAVPVRRKLLERLAAAERNERHRTTAETRYWCDQYKQIARALLADREGVKKS